MEHKNYERELKYLIKKKELSFESILVFLKSHNYKPVETKIKKKHESYYDDLDLSFIKNGDVIRSSKHYNEKGTYYHFLYKKNVSDPLKPYVTKFEYGSGQFEDVRVFLAELGVNSAIQPNPVLYAEMTRETAIVEKGADRFLISYDDVLYFRNSNSVKASERMLEIEDWNTPNSVINAESKYDEHLCEINKIIIQDDSLPLQLTKDSKPFRGNLLLWL